MFQRLWDYRVEISRRLDLTIKAQETEALVGLGILQYA